MKRAIVLIILVITCIFGFLTIKGTLPFTPIFGTSMEPALHSGGLLVIKPVNPSDIKMGDIIVYNTPDMARNYYNYPPVLAHRVIEIKTAPTLAFRTRGDNAGIDPFIIQSWDVRGTAGSQIPFLGLPLLFLQSQYGLLFVLIALALLAALVYSADLARGALPVYRRLFAPAVNTNRSANRALTRHMRATRNKVDTTGELLDKFSKGTVGNTPYLVAQNPVVITPIQQIANVAARPESASPKMKEPTRPDPLPKKANKDKGKPFHGALKGPVPPGCARKPPEITDSASAAENEIFSALDKLHDKLSKSGKD